MTANCDNGAGETKSCGVCGECEGEIYTFVCSACIDISPCILQFKDIKQPITPINCPFEKELAPWKEVKKEKTAEVKK